jgi:hypothetical protein
MKSLEKGRPMDTDGIPLPWMNFPVIKLLEERLNRDQLLFEYGCGYSTLFFADRVKSVESVEHDEKWYNTILTHIPKNVHLEFKELDIDGEYCRMIRKIKSQYNVVIVDGRDRVNCIKQSMSAVSKNGVILLDDSQRERYGEAFSIAESHGYKALNLEGLKPTGTGVDRTTVFYGEGNCFGL